MVNIATDSEGTVLMWSDNGRPTPPEGGQLIELTEAQAAAFKSMPPNRGLKFDGQTLTAMPDQEIYTPMRIRPHTLQDLDRYGPLAVQPLPLSSPVWDGTEFSAADTAALRVHFREHIAPRIEAACTNDPARYLEILASLRAHLFLSTEG